MRRLGVVLSIWAALAASSSAWAMDPAIVAKHTDMLYPTARVLAGSRSGSGTVIFSAPLSGDSRRATTFVLTAYHVVSEAIDPGKAGSPSPDQASSATGPAVTVELFEYVDWSVSVGELRYDGDVAAYSEEEDLALIRLRTARRFEHVARLRPPGAEPVHIFEEIYAVGASAGFDPLPTRGEILGLDYEIEGHLYTVGSASTTFGGSGGGVYLASTRELIGLAARVAVMSTGPFSIQPLTHLGFFIPMETIDRWLAAAGYDFLRAPRPDGHTPPPRPTALQQACWQP